MNSSMDPNDWWESSEADLKAMDACYNKKLYGVSAYHCQQALEKAIKSAALSYNLRINPKKLGHDILLSLFMRMVKGLTTQKKKGLTTEAQDAYFRRVIVILKAVSGNVQIDVDRKTVDNIMSAMDFFWGHSLKIKVKNKKFKKFVIETNEYMLDAMNETAWVSISNVWKCGPNMKPEDFNKLIDYMYRIIGQKLKIKKPELRILCWSLPHIITILKIIPHEEYGRYPGSLHGITREKLYRHKRKALRELELDVKNAINDLNKNVRRNTKKRNTQ